MDLWIPLTRCRPSRLIISAAQFQVILVRITRGQGYVGSVSIGRDGVRSTLDSATSPLSCKMSGQCLWACLKQMETDIRHPFKLISAT